MILLIYNEAFDKITCNSILRMLINLNKYRDDIIVYKIFINVPSAIKKYKKDILEIISKNNIKLIFCVCSYLAYTRKYQETNINKCIKKDENIIQYLNEMNLNIKILCHTHDFFLLLNQYNNLKNIDSYVEIGFEDQIKIFLESNKKIYGIMHCATNNFIKEINLNPINKILLSGDIYKIFYPERFNLYQYYEKNKEKIDFLKHPGHFNISNNYPEILNSYIACFYSSIENDKLKNNRIILAKAFEITATGSLLLAHESCKDSLTRIGFIENINCMFISENNYDKVIDYILDENNRTKINEIRKSGQELVLKNHTENHRIVEINKILDDIILESNNYQ